jgi:hypothetical protein
MRVHVGAMAMTGRLARGDWVCGLAGLLPRRGNLASDPYAS